MASYHWVAEKAVPLLKKNPNMGAKKIQEELENKYQVKIGYRTVHKGTTLASEHIFGHGKKVLDISSTSRQRLSSGCQEVL